MGPKAPFRLLYNNDTTNTVGVVSPWHEEGEPFREDMLVASIEEVTGTRVDAYMLSPGMGWVPWWQSEVDAGFYDWWRARTGLEVVGWGGNGYDRYVAEGGDMVQVLDDTCRKRSMAPFVSLRLNDVHLQENYARTNQASLVSCRLYVEHPEWHIDPDHPKKEGYYKRRGMDWAIPEVRDYKLALLEELSAKYGLAGLELDFLRDDTLFVDEMPEQDRIEIVTEFVAQVRRALDRKQHQRRWLCVRIPLQLSAHPRIGLDVQRLHGVGVDMLNLSGWYHTPQRSDVEGVRKLAPHAAIYLEMTHSAGGHPYFLEPGLYGTNGNPRTSDHHFYTTARLAHRRGADGLSLFNFVYYRMGHRSDVPVMEPPFHVLPKLNDPGFLARQNAYYVLGGLAYFRQVPRVLATDKPVTFDLDMLPTPSDRPSNQAARVRLHTEEALTSAHTFTVQFNGCALDACPDTTRFFGNPFDPMISPPEHRQAWYLPEDRVRDGINRLKVELQEGPPVKVIYVDAGTS